MTPEKSENPLATLVDFETLKLKPENLTEKQRKVAHLIDPRFFEGGANPFREGKSKKDYVYNTPVELDEELFYLHPLMDPAVLEQGNVRRFPAGINEKYISEKYFEDKWVSEGNNELSKQLESWVEENLDRLKKKDKIRLVDIGPCGGAITTLFALRALHKYGLQNKVEVALLDIVPNVLEATLAGRFNVPDEMLKEYGMEFLGEKGANYKVLLKGGVLHGVKEWYESHPENKPSEFTANALSLSEQNETSLGERAKVHYYRGDGEILPKGVQNADIVLSAYTHHHMNFLGRKSLCQQMEQAAGEEGFIGIADFYVPTYEDYMQWYKPHFQNHGDAPPVECPLVDGQTLSSWLGNSKLRNNEIKNLVRTFVFSATKKPSRSAEEAKQREIQSSTRSNVEKAGVDGL